MAEWRLSIGTKVTNCEDTSPNSRRWTLAPACHV